MLLDSLRWAQEASRRWPGAGSVSTGRIGKFQVIKDAVEGYLWPGERGVHQYEGATLAGGRG